MENKLNFHLIDNKSFLDETSYRLKNEVYELWAKEWEAIYASQGSPHKPSADGFFRYDLVNCLSYEGRVVGCTAHSFLQVEDKAALQVEFFQNYSPHFQGTVSAAGSRRWMTFESLLLTSGFKLKQINISLGLLLIYLGMNVFCETDAQALTAIARNDNQASRLSQRAGFQVLEPDIPCRNFPCDALLMEKPTAERIQWDGPDREIVNQVWEGRQYHLGDRFHRLQPSAPPLRRRHLKVA